MGAMNNQQFYQELMNSVRTRATVESDYTISAFLQEAVERLIEAEELLDFIPVHFSGTGIKNRRLAVTAYDEDESDDSVALAIVYFESGAYPETLGNEEAKRQFTAMKYFVEESLTGIFQKGREESTPEYALAENLRRRARGVTRYRFYLLTNKILSSRAKDLSSETIEGIPVEYHIWDIDRFRRVFESTLGREELTIDLSEWMLGGVPALRASTANDDTSTYLCVLPGRLIADLYGRYGGRLLQSNVRAYLSNTGKVNRGIRETVQKEPELFLAYNNGITATATAVELKESSIIRVTDLQIVNGGQTTASLFYVGREPRTRGNLDETFVQAKLVVVAPDTAERLVPNISRYANSQNRINDADFFSNSPFHVRMEEFSRRLLTPPRAGSTFQNKWFYERTRGQYASEKSKLNRAGQDKFTAMYPKDQVITKTDAAKFVMSWERQPYTVSTGAQKNFVVFAKKATEEWNKSSDSFNESYFKDLVAQAILYNNIRAAVAKQSWYEHGYLAQIVTYTIAKISDVVIKEHKGKFNLDAVWQRQGISDATMQFALDVARQVLAILTWSGRSKANVTEWAKDPACWERVQGIACVMPEAFMSELVSSAAVRSAKRDALGQQRMDNSIQAQIAVVREPPGTWPRLKQFAIERGFLGMTDVGILTRTISQGAASLSDKQAHRMLALLQRAAEYGFERDTV